MKLKTLSTLIAVCAVLVVLVFTANTFGQAPKVGLCHANAPNDYSFVFISENALDAHYDRDLMQFKNGHDLDFFADTAEECTRTTPGGEEPPGAVPEPLTILLFGAGVAGVGYATRRLRRKSDADSGEQD